MTEQLPQSRAASNSGGQWSQAVAVHWLRQRHTHRGGSQSPWLEHADDDPPHAAVGAGEVVVDVEVRADVVMVAVEVICGCPVETVVVAVGNAVDAFVAVSAVDVTVTFDAAVSVVVVMRADSVLVVVVAVSTVTIVVTVVVATVVVDTVEVAVAINTAQRVPVQEQSPLRPHMSALTIASHVCSQRVVVQTQPSALAVQAELSQREEQGASTQAAVPVGEDALRHVQR